MAVTFTINDCTMEAARGASLFDCAERMGVRVPTSCQKQGKCRECIVELVEGTEFLSPPTTPERHLTGAFRLSCQAQIAADSGAVRCHTMRRGQLRIESGSAGLPAAALWDGSEARPGYGIAMDLGTTTVVLRLFDLRSGKLRAATSFENPQRFGGSDVMSRIAYDTAHPGRC